MSGLYNSIGGVVGILAIVAVAYAVYHFFFKNKENFEDSPLGGMASGGVESTTDELDGGLTGQSVDFQPSADAPAQCFPRDRLTANDLLPNDAANSKYASITAAGQGDVDGRNYLTSAYHQGIDTVGSSKKNANRQLRSEPPNPQVQVSPWNQTTITPDINRRPLEIGGDF
jgi:hypothetical protein